MPRLCQRALVGIAFLLAMGATRCFAADNAAPWAMPRFSDDTTALYKAASDVTAPPGSEISVLDDEDSFVFEADGRSVRTRYMVYRVLTQNDVGGWSELSVGWEPWHEERPTVRARVITPDGVVHLLDPNSITDAAASDDDHRIYGDSRVIRAPLPAISAGSLVEEEETWRESKPIFDSGIVTRLYFGRMGVPVQSSRLVLEAPAALPIRYHLQLLPESAPSRNEENGRVKLVFEFGPMAPLDDADDDMPSDVPPYPNIAFSTGNSWQAVADNYANIVNQQIALSDVKALVGPLIASQRSRDDKVTAILQFISREIRYTGVEFDEAAITPRPPGETLKRKYGDCKDKATLLVAMLRAAGIPSSIALLSVGQRQDVWPDLPGMGSFDHAIVYVQGNPGQWIDATDEYTRLGELPLADQGRLALVTGSPNSALTSTPVSSSADNLLLEKREFYLAENGPARIVETSQPHGSLESNYRGGYLDPQNKDTRKELSDYFREQYLAEKLDRIDRSDPADLSKQFELVLESKSAKRGVTNLAVAAVGIRFDGLFSRLPSELQEREKKPSPGSADADKKAKKPRTADFQLSGAFATEWQYTIFPPAGFRSRPLPQDAKLSLGPATLSESFSASTDGVVHATIRFDTAKNRLTVAEADEMRDKISELKEGAPIVLYFDPVGQTLLSQGKVREAIQAYRDLVATHPKEAIHHLQIAQALLAAGLGETARSEARAAVKLEPNSALAEKTLADILEYDVVGRKPRPGSDYVGAEAAFRAAEKLDPDDKATVGNLAIFLEYNRWGVRYGVGARLKDSIAEYRKLTAEELGELGLSNNLAFVLFYAGEFSDAQKNAETLNPKPAALIVACEAVLNGAQAALGRARTLTEGDDQFKEIARTAGQMLVNLRNYTLAADLMEAGAAGDNASGFVADAAMYRRTKPFEHIVFPDDPGGVATSFDLLGKSLDLTVDQVRARCSRNGTLALANQDFVDARLRKERDIWTSKSRRQMIPEVGVDTSMTNAQPRVQGDDILGYKVTLWPTASYKESTYVVKENGQYRILATSADPAGVGLEVLDRVAANDLTGARALLDWLREDWRLGGGDDPFFGPAFPRFWTKGRNGDAESVKLAAAAIMTVSKATAPQSVAIFEKARDSASDDALRFNIEFALLAAHTRLDEYDKMLAASVAFAKEYPESRVLFLTQSNALHELGKYDEADRLAAERLQHIPGDRDAMRAMAINAAARLDYASARALTQKLIDSGVAEFGDLNDMAWYALFVGKVEKSDIDDALKATQLGSNNGTLLHTLGCVYAEAGSTEKARGVLLQAMDALNLNEPDDDFWFAFGQIAEQYGERDAAIADYSRVTKPKSEFENATSAYRLAQLRLQALHAESPKESAASVAASR